MLVLPAIRIQQPLISGDFPRSFFSVMRCSVSPMWLMRDVKSCKATWPRQDSYFETAQEEESKPWHLPVPLYLVNYSDLCVISHYDDSFHLLKITIGQVLSWVLYYPRYHHPSKSMRQSRCCCRRWWWRQYLPATEDLICARHCAKYFTFTY